MVPMRRPMTRAVWRTSTYSSSAGGNCVEVGPATGVVGVRDTKARDRGALAVAPATWAAFVRGVKRSA